jgi:hypothetical protein
MYIAFLLPENVLIFDMAISMITSTRVYGLFLFLLLHLTAVRSQQLYFENISNIIDLPSQECYNIMQDSRGYIWFSTESGLCRYNGVTLRVFGKKDKLEDFATFDVNEDRNGKIWAVTSGNRIVQITDSIAFEPAYSIDYRATLKNNIDVNYALDFEGDSLIYLTGNVCTRRFNIKTNKSSVYSRPERDSVFYYFRWEDNGYRHYKSEAKTGTRTRGFCLRLGYIPVQFSKGNKSITIKLPFSEKIIPDWRALSAHDSKGNWYFSIQNYVLCIAPDMSYRILSFPKRLLSLYLDKDDGLWAGIYRGGVYYYADPADTASCVHSLVQYSVTGTCEDHEHGIWCTTLEKSIFYSRSKKVITYSDQPGLEKMADMIVAADPGILISTEPNELLLISNGNVQQRNLQTKLNTTFSHGIHYRHKWYLASKEGLVVTDDNFSAPYVFPDCESPGSRPGVPRLSVGHDSVLWGAQFGFIAKINERCLEIINRDALKPGNRILAISPDEIIYGGRVGLSMFNVRARTAQKIDGPEKGITDIIQTATGNVYVSLGYDGILKLTPDHKKLIPCFPQLKIKEVNDMHMDRYGSLWLSTAYGIVRISDPDGTPSFTYFTVYDGLPSNKIETIVTDDRDVYCNTTEGVFRFPLSEPLNEGTQPFLHLVSIRAGDTTYLRKQEQLLFDAGTNNLLFRFDVLEFKNRKQPRLSYFLPGYDNHVRQSLNGDVELQNLPAGKYTLTVFPYAANGSRENDRMLIHFEIRPQFWNTWWFYTAIVIVFVLLLFFVFRFYIIRIRRKETEKARINTMIAEYRLSALQTQINPHFIFNVINSIQVYILENDTLVAYDYLARFSKLMRIVLNMARQKTHTLESELELLTMYIDLEQLRFEKRFVCEIDIDPDLNTHDFRVLPMLFQPFVENAIWHGLLPLKNTRPGKLKIAFRKKGTDSVSVIIEDNGIGREAAGRISRHKSHSSVAVSLNQERLQLLSQVPGFDSSGIRIIDLKDAAGNACGTRVEITLTALTDTYD